MERMTNPSSIRTLNLHHSSRLDYAKIAGSCTCIISRFLNFGESQDIFADWQIIVRCKIGCGILSPFYEGHRRAYRDAGEIQRCAQHHFAHCRWRNREIRCDATYWRAQLDSIIIVQYFFQLSDLFKF